MKKIVYYQCEICHTRYNTADEAMDCEERPAPVEYPIGMIFGDNRKGAFYEKCLFAIAENYVDKHWNHFGLWATRDMSHGDNFGKELCGGGNFSDRINPTEKHVDPTTHRFERMVKWLKSKEAKKLGVKKITVWDGEKPVPLKEWLDRSGK